jgi:hypothetical protein
LSDFVFSCTRHEEIDAKTYALWGVDYLKEARSIGGEAVSWRWYWPCQGFSIISYIYIIDVSSYE